MVSSTLHLAQLPETGDTFGPGEMAWRSLGKATGDRSLSPPTPSDSVLSPLTASTGHDNDSVLTRKSQELIPSRSTMPITFHETKISY